MFRKEINAFWIEITWAKSINNGGLNGIFAFVPLFVPKKKKLISILACLSVYYVVDDIEVILVQGEWAKVGKKNIYMGEYIAFFENPLCTSCTNDCYVLI